MREHEKPHEYMDRIAREGWEANLNHSLPQHYYRDKLKKRDKVLRVTGYLEDDDELRRPTSFSRTIGFS